MDAAGAEFHQHFAAQDFRAIVERFTEGDRPPFDGFAKWLRLMRRNYGAFVEDTRDLGTYGDEGFSAAMGTTTERWYNTEYSGTKMPIVEKFTWLIVNGTIRLRSFQIHPNAEARCGWHLSPGGHFFMLRSCEHAQLGLVPAIRPA